LLPQVLLHHPDSKEDQARVRTPAETHVETHAESYAITRWDILKHTIKYI
jgi:hypothetical protein